MPARPSRGDPDGVRDSGISNLLERAGLARELLAGKRSVRVLAAARHLKSEWFKVAVVFTGAPGKLPPDAGCPAVGMGMSELMLCPAEKLFQLEKFN